MTDKPRPDALAYDASPTTALARRGVRLLRALTFLTLVNTVMLGGFVLGPHLSPFLKQQWQQWQAERAQRKQRLAEIAIQNQCLNYTAPADKVVYEEDPDEGAKLLAAESADYQPAVVGRPGFAVPAGWRPPVRVKLPQPFQQFIFTAGGARAGGGGGSGFGGGFGGGPIRDGAGALLFLHGRTTPGGRRQLVAVRLLFAMRFQGGSRGSAEETFVQHKERKLVTTVYSLASAPGDAPPSELYAQSLSLLPSDGKGHVAARLTREWVEGKAPAGVEQLSGGYERLTQTLDYGNRLRFFPGQADAADPSHFTIPYRLDGRDGVIDGWLRDDGVRLQPRAGKLTFDDAEPAWDLSATTTSAPSSAPDDPSRN